MNNPITERQKQLLSIIYQYIKSTGYPPTFEEMRENLGVRSNQSVIDHLEKLVTSRFIKKNEGARSLAILPLGYEVLGQPSLTAFLGMTSAGAPIEVVSIPGEWHILPSMMNDKIEKLQDQVSLLKISGDSMINAGIDENDIVLVQSKKEFVSGDIVLARVGDSSTIKRFMSTDTPPYVYLKPENPKYQNILFTPEVHLEGKVISVLKSGYWQPIK